MRNSVDMPRIAAVDLADDGVVVRYDDGTLAFYHESVLLTHLAEKPVKKPVRPAPLTGNRHAA